MSPLDRKAELVRKQRTMADLARQLDVSLNHVSQVVLGRRRSPRVEQAIAEALDRPVEEVFGDAATAAA